MQNDEPKTIFILNGPNLNMLGTRQPEVYGVNTLVDIKLMCEERAHERGFEIDFRQSNDEGKLIDWIHEAQEKACGIIINPAAYTHTSVAIHDALLMFENPVIEVHISNIHKREEFRHISYVSKAADAIICGLGSYGYVVAVKAMAEMLR